MSYFSRIFKTGAVRKTPARIIKRIIAEIPSRNGLQILELGAGKGEITIPLANLSRNQHPESRFYAIELEKDFADELKRTIPGTTVLQGNALDFPKLVPEDPQYDLIISSMPLSFFKKSEKETLFLNMKARLKPGGKILILYHAAWLGSSMKSLFSGGRVLSFATIPPYFLYIYNHESKS